MGDRDEVYLARIGITVIHFRQQGAHIRNAHIFVRGVGRPVTNVVVVDFDRNAVALRNQHEQDCALVLASHLLAFKGGNHQVDDSTNSQTPCVE
jgi:hypothetical protein